MYTDRQTHTIEIQVRRITAQGCLSLELQSVPPHPYLTPWLPMLPSSASLPSDMLPTAPPQPELEAEHWPQCTDLHLGPSPVTYQLTWVISSLGLNFLIKGRQMVVRTE